MRKITGDDDDDDDEFRHKIIIKPRIYVRRTSRSDPKAAGTNTRVLRSRQRVISAAASDGDYTPAGRDVIIQSNGPR